MKKTRLNIALIGAGGIGRLWAAAIKKVPGVSLMAVADVDLKKARELAGGFPGCRAERDWKKIVREKNIEAVIVATPHHLLSPISQAALTTGKHVLSEKPGALNSGELKKAIALADKKKGVYMIGFNHRYHAAFLMAKKLFDRGEIGKPLFVRARYGFGGRAGYQKEWRFNKKISGGGELLDQGVHMIDLARLFLGNFSKTFGFAENLFWGGDVEDNGLVILRTPKGQMASIHVSWTNWKWVHSFEIYGDRGYLLIDGLDQRYQGPERLTIGKRDPALKKPPVEKTLVFPKEQKEDSLARELADFSSAVRGQRRPIPTGKDAHEVLKVVEKVYNAKA